MPPSYGNETIGWRPGLIGQWGLLKPAPAWPIRPSSEQKGAGVSELSDAIRRLFARFARPRDATLTGEHDAEVDDRLSTLERKQLEIKARLSILEKAGNPRGIGRE